MASRAVTIDLGDMAERAAEHVRSGRFASLDAVVQAGIAALGDGDDPDWVPDGWTGEEWDEHVRAKVQEALDDPRPSVPWDEAKRRLDEAKVRRRT